MSIVVFVALMAVLGVLGRFCDRDRTDWDAYIARTQRAYRKGCEGHE